MMRKVCFCTLPLFLLCTPLLGQTDSLIRTYYGNGHIKTESNYKSRLKNGLQILFYNFPNCPKEESHYRNDTLVGYRTLYYRDCRVKRQESFMQGKRNGLVLSYRRNGSLRSELLFTDGKGVGKPIKYAANGSIKNLKKAIGSGNLDAYAEADTLAYPSAVFNALDSLKPDKHTVIIADVTGSMAPYAGELLYWYRKGTNYNPHGYVFFNDGDGKQNRLKTVGKVGGLYPIQPKGFEQLQSVMELAMLKGNGGDPQENNLEAALYALKKYRRIRRIIMIADRTSPVRDMRLLPKLKVPVYVILAGLETYTHANYLEIAYRTGGAVISLNQSLDLLPRVKEGTKLTLLGLEYIVRGGHFQMVPLKY